MASKRYEVRVGRIGIGQFNSLPHAVKVARKAAAEEAAVYGIVQWVVLDLVTRTVVRDGIVNA